MPVDPDRPPNLAAAFVTGFAWAIAVIAVPLAVLLAAALLL